MAEPYDSGIWLYRSGRFERALSVFEAGAEEDRCADCWYGIALVHASAARLRESMEAARRAVALREDFGAAWRVLGMLALREGRLSAMSQSFERALACSSAPQVEFMRSCSDAFADAGDETSALLDAPSRIEISLLDAQGFVVDVSVHRQSADRWFFDTGTAPFCVLDAAAATELGVRVSARSSTTALAGARRSVGFALLESLRIGPIQVERVPVAVVDLAGPGTRAGVKGILSPELFRGRSVEVDHAARRIVFESSADAEASEGSENHARAELRSVGGLLLAQIGVGPEIVWMAVDTGCRVGRIDPRVAVAAGSVPRRAKVSGGNAVVFDPEVPIRFGDWLLRGMVPMPHHLETTLPESVDVAGVLGSELFRRHRLRLEPLQRTVRIWRSLSGA